jgi:hypothetical protein
MPRSAALASGSRPITVTLPSSHRPVLPSAFIPAPKAFSLLITLIAWNSPDDSNPADSPIIAKRGSECRSEGRYSDSPCPWEANEKRSAFTHWHLMDIGGSESAAPRGDTPIRPVHGMPMKSAPHSLIGTSCASADRNAERAIASLLKSRSASRMAEGNPPLLVASTREKRHGGVLGCQDLRLGDFETVRVRRRHKAQIGIWYNYRLRSVRLRVVSRNASASRSSPSWLKQAGSCPARRPIGRAFRTNAPPPTFFFRFAMRRRVGRADEGVNTDLSLTFSDWQAIHFTLPHSMIPN